MGLATSQTVPQTPERAPEAMDGTIVDDEIVNDEIVDDEMMDTRPLLSFDNFVNNRPHRNDTSYIKMAKYIGKVMLGSFPKIIIIVSN